ncbi:hypothetical protein AAFF_G00256800 [Aldrovandia affinis]|uniref:Uncharacterized protein n=1 Tax=Aldrovandia affinis TaxID=143900 RepID=A0AAD7WSX7_9TELE|nr:hypothetical protein AAFF_G00256800 [Aldrovandia affinis]
MPPLVTAAAEGEGTLCSSPRHRKRPRRAASRSVRMKFQREVLASGGPSDLNVERTAGGFSGASRAAAYQEHNG